MSVLAQICGVKGAFYEIEAPPSAARIRAIVAAESAGLCEPDLPIGRLALPRDPVDRAVLAIVTRGAPRALLFVRNAPAKLARVKDSLEFQIEFRMPFAGPPLVEAALAELRERGPLGGRELLRAARARVGRASTEDSSTLSRALVRAWTDGVVTLKLR